MLNSKPIERAPRLKRGRTAACFKPTWLSHTKAHTKAVSEQANNRYGIAKKKRLDHSASGAGSYGRRASNTSI
jgi:hypothetical protein